MTHHTAEEDTGEAEITASQPRVLRGPVEPSLKATYPDVRTSRLLRYRKLLFVFINRYFGVVPAVLYLMTVWMVSATVVHPDPDSLADVLAITGCAWHRNPSLTLWAFFVTAVLVIFTDTHSRLYRWLGGLAHGAANLAGMFCIGWGAMLVARWLFAGWPSVRFGVVAVLVAAGGWFLGSVLMSSPSPATARPSSRWTGRSRAAISPSSY